MAPEEMLMLANYGVLTFLPTPIRSGYRFDGWFTEKTGGMQVTEDTVYTADTIIYAHWKHSSSSDSKYTITAIEAENGEVRISPKNASKGTTVNISVIPDNGYTLEALTVLDKNGNEIKLTEKGNGKYSFKMPDGKVMVNATFMEDNTMRNFFVDVCADKYYYEAVQWAVQRGITGGVDENHFGPGQSCSRAQLVTFLWRAAGRPEPRAAVMSFKDVSAERYSYKAVLWAVESGIAKGTTDSTFSPDANCTRAQIVTFLFRYAAAQGMDGVTLQELVSGYGDADSVPGYAISAFNWALGGEIVRGANGNLMPNDDCTRAQIVTMLYRLLSE